MADPATDHSFVYTEDDYVDILASPFFDVKPGVDTTVNGYIERIRYTLVKSLEVQLGVFPRSGPEDNDYPLHPSYVALQTLYRKPHTSSSSTTSATVSDIQSSAPAEISPVPSSGGFFTSRASCYFLGGGSRADYHLCMFSFADQKKWIKLYPVSSGEESGGFGTKRQEDQWFGHNPKALDIVP